MYGTICEISELLGMAEREASAAAAAHVTGVGGGRRISAAEGSAKRAPVDGAGPAAVSDRLKLAIPT